MTKTSAVILAIGLFASSVMIYFGLIKLGESIHLAQPIDLRLQVEGKKFGESISIKNDSR